MTRTTNIIGGELFPDWEFRQGVNFRKAVKEKRRLRTLFRNGVHPSQIQKRVNRLVRMKVPVANSFLIFDPGSEQKYDSDDQDLWYLTPSDQIETQPLEGAEMPDLAEINEIRRLFAQERLNISRNLALDSRDTYFETALDLDEDLSVNPNFLRVS
ncbi:hypothetical protein EXS65_03780 [Candidatus Peribacteria bacterium]|nr:hypothetical protein [Candidatus Peribacteria bacterium]